MTENTDQVLIDLLIKQATEGLTDVEQAELDRLERGRHDNTIDVTVSAISLIDERGEEPMPSHVRANIRAAAERFFDEKEAAEFQPAGAVAKPQPASRTSFPTWLGWAVATAACLVLAMNIYFTQVQPGPRVDAPTPTPTREVASIAEERQKFMASATDMVKALVTKGSMKEISDVTGDIVWSDSEQRGYVKVSGLPVNDKNKETYQLWIFDEAHDKKAPVSGGVFDVDKNGDVIIPIKAALKVLNPGLFAVTMEKPGGVMVTDQKRIAVVGKPETQSS